MMVKSSTTVQVHWQCQAVAVTLSEEGSILSVVGRVNFNNVVRLREEAKRLLVQSMSPVITIDLQGVDSSDNSGLVLLVSWVQDARRMNKTLTFRHVPDFLQRMAEVFGLHDLLFKP